MTTYKRVKRRKVLMNKLKHKYRLVFFNDNTFDLITCFGTLHHIPNVTFVLNELIRILKPNGYLLIREPIISMGDWRIQRNGLTKNERGIPVKVFNSILKNAPVVVVKKSYCYTMTSFIQKIVKKIFPKANFISTNSYLFLDKFLSKLLFWNINYYPINKFQRCAPSNVFLIIKKNK